MRIQVPSLDPISGLRIWCCRELWWISKAWLRSGIAAAMVSTSIWPLAWEVPYAACAVLKSKKIKNKFKKIKKGISIRRVGCILQNVNCIILYRLLVVLLTLIQGYRNGQKDSLIRAPPPLEFILVLFPLWLIYPVKTISYLKTPLPLIQPKFPYSKFLKERGGRRTWYYTWTTYIFYKVPYTWVKPLSDLWWALVPRNR